MTFDQATTNLAAALLLGAAIGFERQWRNRLAGLRTNTLVSLGAAGFVIFEGLFPGDSSPTRMAAQVVSGIGFLGAGIIFRAMPRPALPTGPINPANPGSIARPGSRGTRQGVQ